MEQTWRLNNAQDVDVKVEQLRKILKQQLNEHGKVDFEL